MDVYRRFRHTSLYGLDTTASPEDAENSIEVAEKTFISESYLNQFGKPDQTFDIPLEDELFIQWYWYEIDVVAEFVAPKDETDNGWEISFAISLAPLKYYQRDV